MLFCPLGIVGMSEAYLIAKFVLLEIQIYPHSFGSSYVGLFIILMFRITQQLMILS